MTTFALLTLGHLLRQQTTPPPLEPAIAYVGKLAGEWDAVAHVGKDSFKCHFKFEWNDDHRGIHSAAVIAMDSAHPMHSYSMMGYDPNAKAPYYVDAHDSDTLYTGHFGLEDNKLVFRFGNYGKGEKEFVSTEWFTDDDHYTSEIRQAAHPTDPPMVKVDLTRVKAS
jgi:hypothetical protein